MSHVHGGNIEQARQKYNLHNKKIIDFSANINFMGPPIAIKGLLRKKWQLITRYPEPQAMAFKKELAEQLNIQPQNIIIGNGAVEIIYQLLHILQPGVCLIPAPSFSEYEYAVRSIKKDIKRIYLQEDNNFRINIDEYINNFKNVDIAFICNPHNPTGMILKKDKIMEIIKAACEDNVWLIIDESFIDFVIKSKDYTIIDNIKKYNNLFLIRSLTKFFAIPGLRLGYGIGPEKLIEEMEMRRDPWSVNILAQEAGKIAIKDKEYIRDTKIVNKKERNYFYKELKKIKNIKVFKPAANFIFIKILNKLTTRELIDIMAMSGILVRDCNSYCGLNNKYIRVAVKSRKENKKLLTVLNNVINNRKGYSDENRAYYS